jgi:two-component system chemotaxis response regulator CheB
MKPRRLIVMGASAGGFDPLKVILAGLPADLAAAILIVVHIPPDSPGFLPRVFGRICALPVDHAMDGDPLRTGQVYFAPPDRHIVIEDGCVRVSRGPKENFSRPAIDPLFRSAAQYFGRRTIGVVLSGCLDDGTAGCWTIKRRGGVTIAQDPAEAIFPSMPRSACAYVEMDYCLPAREIATVLISQTAGLEPNTEEHPVTKELEVETAIAKGGDALSLGVMDLGTSTPYTCPECHGVLLALKEGGTPRFRCHTGHAYSLSSLLSEVTSNGENSLWNATREIEEGIMLMEHASRHLLEKGNRSGAELLASKAKSSEARVRLLRSALAEHEAVSLDLLDDDREL